MPEPPWLSPRRHPDPIEAAAGLLVIVALALIVIGAVVCLIVDALAA